VTKLTIAFLNMCDYWRLFNSWVYLPESYECSYFTSSCKPRLLV